MSGKNRAFALAAATAALVGLSVPVAGAATLQGPSGFNNDSLVNVSGNQVPVTACNVGAPVNAVLAQVPLTALALVSGNGMLNTNKTGATSSQTCAPSSTQQVTSTTNTNSNNGPQTGTTGSNPGSHPAKHHGPSGFNNDSLVKVSNNQIPVAICNIAAPIAATGIQVPVTVLTRVVGSGALNSNTQNSPAPQGCTPTAGQHNSSTVNTDSNNHH